MGRYMPKGFMHRILAIIIFSIAVIQLYGIGDKVIHASWQWYKFYGYSNEGYTTINISMALFTYITSIITIIIGYRLYKTPHGKLTDLTIKYSSYSLFSGILLLSVLLISPLGQLVQS
jgi:hypothetical protein